MMFGRFAFVTAQMVRRDIAQRYRGSVGGLLWAVVQPLLMLTIYTLVFGSVLKVKWPGAEDSLDYALILFIGLVPYMFVSEGLARAPSLIVGSANLVKKIAFPLQVLPVMSVATAALHALIADTREAPIDRPIMGGIVDHHQEWAATRRAWREGSAI